MSDDDRQMTHSFEDEGIDDAAEYEGNRIYEDDEFEQYDAAMEAEESGLDADSVVTPNVDDWRESQDREKALNLSAASVGVTADAHQILKAAQEFYSFLQGNDYTSDPTVDAAVGVQYPYNDEAGNTILAEGVLLSANLENILVGKRIYKYVSTYQD